MNHGDSYPRLAGLCAFFVVFGESSILGEPAEGALDHPPSGEHDKALHVVGTLDDLHRPSANTFREPLEPAQEFSRIAAVRPEKAEAGKECFAQRHQAQENQLCAVSILYGGTVNHNHQEQAQRVYRDVSLASLDALGGIVPAVLLRFGPLPPFCAVFTDWLSIIAAEGVGSCPS